MSFQGDSIFWVEVEKVVPNPFQPRREFDEEKLQELADSIRMYGILQPLTVTRKEVHTDDGAFYTQYELIAGERRLRASKLAGIIQVPVLIRSGEDTEQEKLELAIIENLQREDLNAVDRALAFKQLAEVFKLSHSQVAKKVGRSREYVSNSIRLLALPEQVLTSLKHGDLTEGHARTLLMLKDKPTEQEVVFKEILLKKLSVREVERIARKIATDKVRKKSPLDMDAHLIEMEREFTDTLGTRVQILKTDFGGKLTIDYFEEADLVKLLTVVKSQPANISAALSALALSESNSSDVQETVIREMDSVSPALTTLADATGLEAVTEGEIVSDEVKEEAQSDEETITQIEKQSEKPQESPSVGTPEAVSPAEVVDTYEESQNDTVTDLQEPVGQMVESSDGEDQKTDNESIPLEQSDDTSEMNDTNLLESEVHTTPEVSEEQQENVRADRASEHQSDEAKSTDTHTQGESPQPQPSAAFAAAQAALLGTTAAQSVAEESPSTDDISELTQSETDTKASNSQTLSPEKESTDPAESDKEKLADDDADLYTFKNFSL